MVCNRMLNGNFKKALFWSAFFVWALASSVEAADYVKVSYVVDGDTVVLEDGIHIRMIGINAPEKESETRRAEPYALEARLALAEMVEGVTVKITLGEEEFDRYGRTLAYLELKDGTDVQKQLIARGYAMVIAFPPNIARIENYLVEEKKARTNKLGLWHDQQIVVDLADTRDLLKTGFGIISGTVTSNKRSQRYLQLLITGGVTILIGQKVWKRYWPGREPGEFTGKKIESRGWITKHSGRYWLVVRHPSMLTVN